MIHESANIYKSATIGEGTKVGAFAEIGNKVRIGKNCSIGFGVFIPENVIIEDAVFIGPGTVFTNDKYAPSRGKWRNEPPTIVKSGATIGANSTILPNVIVGKGSIIAAGCVVTKSTEPYSINAGVPNKKIGER